MVDSMKQIFLLKPEVLTPNRNGFMTKKRKWHLKAGSTVYVYKKIVIERTRDLIYLKFVVKDFLPKKISSSAGENAGDSV